MDTAALRGSFLLQDLFAAGEIRLVHIGVERLIVGGIMPGPQATLPVPPELRAKGFHERRESGVINIGDPGMVQVDGEVFRLDAGDGLYIGLGVKEVEFRGLGTGEAAFYLLSCPAHRAYPSRRIPRGEAETELVGTGESASKRRIFRIIHDGGAPSCQLVMGYTELEAGSVWNTWPPHTHERRSEVYLYFGLGGGAVIHLMGEPGETRHLIVRDRQAVVSPPWSMHCGAGTSAYRFIWGMAGENKQFADMDPVDLSTMR